MTKLYHDAGSWVVPGKQGKNASRIDVPQPPDELAAWLNDRAVPPTGYESEEAELQRSIDADAEQLIDDDPLGLGLAIDRPWVRGPAGKNPPRYDTHDQAAVDSGVVFVPIDKAAAIAHSAEQCPICHSGAGAAAMHARFAETAAIADWIGKVESLSAIEEIAITVKQWLADHKAELPEEGTVQ